MTLATLLARCCISRYDCELWFRGCELRGDVLIVPDQEAAGVILRCYVPQFREHVPIDRVMVQPRVKSAPTKPSAFKGGYQPTPTKLLDM